MEITGTISVVNILQLVECQAMYDTLCQVPDGGTVVEVGCDQGRSSSLIFQLAKPKNLLTIHIDPWKEFKDRAKLWMEVMSERCPHHRFVLLHMTTEEAGGLLERLTPDGIDFAFIDGSHDQDLVEKDLQIVASRIKSGGFLTAHDYPSGGVSEAIDPFVAQGWNKQQQAYGYGVWRRD